MGADITTKNSYVDRLLLLVAAGHSTQLHSAVHGLLLVESASTDVTGQFNLPQGANSESSMGVSNGLV